MTRGFLFDDDFFLLVCFPILFFVSPFLSAGKHPRLLPHSFRPGRAVPLRQI